MSYIGLIKQLKLNKMTTTNLTTTGNPYEMTMEDLKADRKEIVTIITNNAGTENVKKVMTEMVANMDSFASCDTDEYTEHTLRNMGMWKDTPFHDNGADNSERSRQLWACR